MRRILIVLTALLAVGCASTPPDDRREAAELYQTARDALARGDYRSAVEDYERLQSLYPFGPYADQGQLDMIFAYAELGEPDSAIAAAERFLRLNPRHERAPYAWYMRGVVDQERGHNVFTGLFDLRRSRRNPEPLERAFDTFGTLIERFPESEYAEDARRRMGEIREMLARHDLEVARFYHSREAWVATANRARRVVQRYPGTAAVPQALQLLKDVYSAVEMTPLRRDIERVLEANGIQAG